MGRKTDGKAAHSSLEPTLGGFEGDGGLKLESLLRILSPGTLDCYDAML